MDHWTRRKFFATTLAGAHLPALQICLANRYLTPLPSHPDPTAKRPVIISSANGLHALGKGMDILKSAEIPSMPSSLRSPSWKTIPTTIPSVTAACRTKKA